MNEKETINALKYFYEAGQLKLVKRTGWWVAKIRDPESVAEHSFRAAIIAYYLAHREGAEEPEKIALSLLFHDVSEARLLDRHKVSSNCFKLPKEIEKKVEREQCTLLGETGSNVMKLLSEQSSIVKDADYLEAAITAREYYDIGYKDAFDWIQRVSKVLKTKTAKELCEQLKKTNSNKWWQGLKEEVS